MRSLRTVSKTVDAIEVALWVCGRQCKDVATEEGVPPAATRRLLARDPKLPADVATQVLDTLCRLVARREAERQLRPVSRSRPGRVRTVSVADGLAVWAGRPCVAMRGDL